jgi:hypothetical protein
MKPIMHSLVFLCAIACVSAQLQVTKLIDNPGNLTVGKDVTVLMRFQNPFGKELPIQIADKNVIGDNGYDIQCLEYALPAQEDIVLGLAAIQPFREGNFTLGKADIKYTNPDTGQEEHAYSEEITVEVKPGTAPQNSQGITTVYQCNGQSMKSTSYQTSSSQSQQSAEQQMQKAQEEMEQQLSEAQQRMQEQMQAMQNSQMMQDPNAFKQQMERQAQEQQQMQEQLEKELSQNQDLQEMQRQLESQGYQQQSKSINPESNDSGDFKYDYQKPSGETAQIEGSMKDGKMQELSKKTSEDEENIRNALQNNSEFRNLDEELKRQGFNQTKLDYSNQGNMTEAKLTYQKGNETANISAELRNTTVTDVKLERETGRSYWWIVLVIISAVLAAYYLYQKKRKRHPAAEMPVPAIHIDHTKEALKMLTEAERLFEHNHEKDAYGKVSEAVRYYCTHKFGDGKELNATETIRLMKHRKESPDEISECLAIAGLVEFAKYKPDRKDFERAMELARKTIN